MSEEGSAQHKPRGPFRFVGQCQLTHRGHARKATSTIHLPKQPRVFSEASSLLFSGAEKCYSELAAKELIFNSPASVDAAFVPFRLGAARLKPPRARRDADRDVR